MNSVVLIGRLVRDPELRYSAGNQTAVCSFTIGVNRPYSKNDESDFPRIVVFGRTAENCGTYLKKGSQVAVQGRIQTGSYETKTGEKRYTTDIVAERVEFLQRASGNNNGGGNVGGGQGFGQQQYQSAGGNGFQPAGGNNFQSSGLDAIPDGFHAFDDEDDDNIPF